VLWVLALASLLVLTGCWDSVEVNDLGIVIATAIDAAPNNQVRVSIQIAVPGQMGSGTGGGMSGGGGKKPYFSVSAVGTDIRDTNQRLQRMVSRQIFVAHRRILLIGEKLAKQDIERQLDEPTRNPQSRLRTEVVVTRGEAMNYLKVSYPFERVPMEGMRKVMYGNASDYKMDLKDLMIMLATPGLQPAIPIVDLTPPSPGESPKFRADGVALFRGGKMIGSLTTHEARGLLWLQDKMKRGTVTVGIPGHKGKVSCKMLRVKSDFDVKMKNGHPSMSVRLRPENDIVENDTDLDVNDPKNVVLVERAYSTKVKQTIVHTVDLLQHRYGVDVTGSSEYIHQAFPSEWLKLSAHWDQEFARMPITVEVDGKIRRIGMDGPSLTRTKGQIEH